MAVPKKKTSKAKSRSRRARAWTLDVPARSVCPRCGSAKLPHVVCPALRVVQGPRRRRRRLTRSHQRPPMLPIAVDAMGGDRGPGEIVAGARRGRRRARHPGRAGRPGRPARRRRRPRADRRRPRSSRWTRTRRRRVRRKKDSSLVRAAEAVRDGRASAMVCAGNTGATMAAALLRMGRIKGVARPAIATPIPVPGRARRPSCSTPAPTPSASPSGWCSSPRWARSSPASASASPSPGSACCRSARSRARATRWARRPTRSARGGPHGVDFIGNVEGRDVMTDDVDVVVTDGFTGNVALKTLEGGMRAARRGAARGVRATDDATKAAADVLLPGAAPAVRAARPRHLRRRHAARRRRRVHHQPRLVVGPRRSSTPSGWRARWSQADLVGRLRRRGRVPPADRAVEHAGQSARRRTSADNRSASGRIRPDPRPGAIVPAETHVEQGPMDRQEVFELIRDRLADILEIEPGTITEGQSFADDLDADSLALIELVEALEEELGERIGRLPHRRRGPRGPEDGARRRRLRARSGPGSS